MQAETDYFSFRDLSVFYKKTGSGRPMIFLHNGGNSHIIWDHQLKYFSATHTCYAVDLPGYGKSVNPHAAYSLDMYSDFLDHFITHFGLAPVTLVGNCIGSAISLAYAMKKPENANSLILFNILTKSTVWDGIFGLFFKWTAPVASVRRTLKKGLGTWLIPKAVTHFSVMSQFGSRGTPDPELIRNLKKNYRLKGQLGALIDILVDIDAYMPIDRFQVPPDFPPAFVLWGADNRILPLAAGQKLCAKLSPRSFEIIKGGGHVVMHELHEEINPLLSDFLGEQ